MSAFGSIERMEPRGVCAGTLHDCELPDARFAPVTASSLAAATGVEEKTAADVFTLSYPLPARAAVVVEGNANVHRVRTATGWREAEASILELDTDEVVRTSGESLLVEVRAGADQNSWGTPVWVGPSSALHAHGSAMLALPLIVMGWLALAGVQQLVSPRRSAQTTGAFATAALNFAALARVAAMQYAWSNWWGAAPLWRRLAELGAIPCTAVAAMVFYRWLAGASLHGRGMRLFYGVAVIDVLAVAATGPFPALRGHALAAGQLLALVAVAGAVAAIVSAWRRLRVDERAFVATGLGGLAGAAIVDLTMARAHQSLVLSAGLVPFALCLETLCQAMILSRRDARAHDEVTRLATVAKEASERELAEQARVNVELQRLDALKDAFVSNTSHELRTPLNGVIGLAESLLSSNEDLSPRTRQGLRMVLSSGRRLDRLVSDLLDFGRAKNGQIDVDLSAVDLAAVVSETLLLLSPTVAEKDLRLKSLVPADFPLARADESRLAQVLQHVVGNAIKFAAGGAVRCEAQRSGHRLVLIIEDDGPGFPEQLLKKGVSLFEQADGSSTRAHGGTGLGLAFASRLMELQGGGLRILNRETGGARVELELSMAPREQQHAPRPRPVTVTSIAPPSRRSVPPPVVAQQARFSPPSTLPDDANILLRAPVVESRSPVRKARLLVADDEPVNLERLELDLEEAGYDLVLVEDGAAAVQAFDDRGPFDLVLLDVMMPKLDGLEACRAIRARAAMSDVPIVMVTARRESKDVDAGFEAGANDYVTKPYVRQELIRRVHAHASVSRITRSMHRFVPQTFATLLGRKHPADIELGDSVEQNLAVVFLDIRGFTAASERMTSRQVFTWLNDQFGAVVPAFHAHGGVVDKYLGDAVMALFPRGSSSAIEAVIAASRALRMLPDSARVGFGVHQGSTMLGALGEVSRIAPTVVSDTVNVAARLEALTRRFDAAALLSDESLKAAASPVLLTRYLGEFRLKGRAKSVRIHELLAASAPEVAERRIAAGVHLARILEHLDARRFPDALEAAERGCDAHPDDAVLGFYATAVEAICSDGAPFDGALELAEK